MRKWQLQAPSTRTVRVVTALGMPPGLHTSRLPRGRDEAQPARPRIRPASVVGRHGRPHRLGRLPRRQAARRDLPASGRPRAQRRGRAVAVRQGSRGRPRRGPDPFARAEPAANAEGARGLLHDFQMVGGRLFFLRGEEELLALDGDTGAVDWSFSPRGTPINPKLWIGPERVVLQVHSPGQLLVLDTDSGTQVARTPLAEGEALERPPVPIDEDHVLLVTDRRTVKKFDMTRGQFTWDLPGEPGDAGLRSPTGHRRRRAGAGAPRRQDADPPRPGERVEAMVRHCWASRT